MEFDWLIPLIFIFIITSLIMSIFSLMGFHPAMLIDLLATTRRTRTEMEPRDHFDRWEQSHRRSAYENRPKRLKYLSTTGDRYVPKKRIGKIYGVEPWLNFYIVYLKTRRFSWSAPFLIPQEFCSDLHRKNLWVRARGFSKVGKIRMPIPIENDTFLKTLGIKNGKRVAMRVPANVNNITDEILNSFEFSMNKQLYMDIMANMHWDIGSGMAPPIEKKVMVTEADQPMFREREYISEDKATGGPIT